MAETTPAGAAHARGARRPSTSRAIIRPQTGAATRPPVAAAVIGRGWSKPTHTAATTSGV